MLNLPPLFTVLAGGLGRKRTVGCNRLVRFLADQITIPAILLTAIFVSGCAQGASSSESSGSSAPSISSIATTTLSTSRTAGQNEQLSSDGSTKDDTASVSWSSSNTGVGSYRGWLGFYCGGGRGGGRGRGPRDRDDNGISVRCVRHGRTERDRDQEPHHEPLSTLNADWSDPAVYRDCWLQ
jgi:hypothetical protein